MTVAERKPRRVHITTTIPFDLADELDAYVIAENVAKNAVLEIAVRAFLVKERQRKMQAEGK